MSCRRWGAGAALSLLVGLIGACHDDGTAPSAAPSVRVTNVAAAANPNNVLSTIATFSASGVDSARVVYIADSGTSGATPFTTTVAPGRIVVLGLAPATTYHLAVQVAAGDTLLTSDTLVLATDTLPSFLQGTHLDSDVPASGGYVLTGIGNSTTAYAVAFDSTGAIAWYRAFSEGVPAGEIKQQVNGDITVFLGATHGGQAVAGRFVEVNPEGDIVRTLAAESPAFTDNHELWLLFHDTTYDGAVYLTYTQRHLDLSADGGPSDTLVSGHQLVRVNAEGSQHTVFDAWDHFTVADNVEPVAGEPDFDHPNAIAIAADGNYVVSWRNFDAITKIDATTGEMLWTLAAPWSVVHSDFTIEGDPLDGFSAQHCVRVVGTDDVILFDNGTHHAPPVSRAVEYRLDETAKTATMTSEHRHDPALFTQFTGSVQRLENGNTFIGWTWPPTLTATDVTSDGNVVWEGTLSSPGAALPYRFTKIASLYHYVSP